MKILVTGATGFIGSHIAAQMAASNHEVRVLLRSTSKRQFLEGIQFQSFEGDITNSASIRPAVRGVDVVVHSAGLVKARSEHEFHVVNALGTANVLNAIAMETPNLKRFVYLSSLAAHGPSPEGCPRTLESRPSPITAYGRTKAQGEELVHKSSLSNRSVVLRLPVVYGPKDLALLPFFQLAKWRLAPLLWGGRNILSVVYAEDAARAAVILATQEAPVGGKTYSADDGYLYSWREMFSHVEAALGRRSLLLPMPLWSYLAAAGASQALSKITRKAASLTKDKVTEMRQAYWICSNAALQTDLDWRPTVSFEEGAKLTAAWYRSKRLL